MLISEIKTSVQLNHHLREGWTLEKMSAQLEAMTEDGEYRHQIDAVGRLKQFVDDGNYPGNFLPPEGWGRFGDDHWGRKDPELDPQDPMGFSLDFDFCLNSSLVQNYLMFRYRDQINESTSLYEYKWIILKHIWKDEYADGYRSLGYPASKVFHQTLYWKVIREYLTHSRGYRCESNRCQRRWADGYMDGKDALEIHHKQYSLHGEEHRHLDTLYVLHRECHQACHPEGRNALEDYW